MDLFRHADVVETFHAGDVVMKKGTAGDRMYVVKDGTVEIRVGDRVAETLRTGDFFGEMALVDHEPRSATAVATSDLQLVAVDEKHFLRMVADTPGFALAVLRVMARRLRAMDARV
jgi:CRP/FNR family transcriptional regulator, cyclic AMP receptor protein